MKKNETLLIIGFFWILAFISIYFYLKNAETNNSIIQKNSVKQNEMIRIKNDKKNIYSDRFFPVKLDYSKDLLINKLEEYNGKTKEEIYEIRKKHVGTSIFADKNYEPSEEVFGQIVSGMPWRALKSEACRTSENPKDEEKIGGISEESRFLNNPNALIGVEKGVTHLTDAYSFCKDDLRYFIPYRLVYDHEYNLISAHYKVRGDYTPGTFNGMNARDLGYKYIGVFKSENFRFTDKNGIHKKPYKLKDFVHLGGSCGVIGGCNNSSPHQSELGYYISELPARIMLKLWHNEPSSLDDTPDAYYEIYLEPETNK